MAAATPSGMKVLQAASARARAGAVPVAATMSDGAETTTARKPMPSATRSASSQPIAPAIAPSSDATPCASMPATAMRRAPQASTAMPTPAPSAAPMAANADSSQDAWARLASSAARSSGRAAGTLPTCMAETMPAPTTSATTRPWRAAPAPGAAGRAEASERDMGVPVGGHGATVPVFHVP